MWKCRLATRLGSLLTAGLCVLQVSSVTAQQNAPEALFAEATGSAAVAAADTTRGFSEKRSRLVTFNRDRILIPSSSGRADAPAAARLTLNLFDDTTVVTVLER